MSENLAVSRRESSFRNCVTAVLRMSGLRPTRQRLALAELLLNDRRHRHVSAEQLYAEAGASGVPVSLATVYNTLHQFRRAGLLREVTVEGARSYFDTNTSDHHHFFIEDEQRMIDIPASQVTFGALPAPPAGLEMTHVNVVIRLRSNRN